MVFPNASRRNGGLDDLDWFDSVRNNTLAKNPVLGKTRYYAAWENKWHDETSLEDGSRNISLKIGEGKRTYKNMTPSARFPGFLVQAASVSEECRFSLVLHSGMMSSRSFCLA